jgi:hypothetical protein
LFALVAACGAPAKKSNDGGAGDMGSSPDFSVGPDFGGPKVGNGFKFAVFGDCRPDSGSAPYPAAIINNIFSLAQSKGAQFVIGTGDYMNTDYNVSAQIAQMQIDAEVAQFKQAQAKFTAGPIYLAMGNHECTGATLSNCPSYNETPNMRAFMTLLPSGMDKPYYRVDEDTPLGKAKFIFIAPNAWDQTQDAWLKTQLADATPYTFVVRHEPSTSWNIPASVTTSEGYIAVSKYTLELLGHTHEYRHVDEKHVISGNAGAQLGGSSFYGLLLVEQNTDSSFTVQEIDQASGNVIDTFIALP